MQPIAGVVQHYPWGDRQFIPAFLGRNPDGQPWAELWLGTHPNGPSRLPDGRALTELTGNLPFLLKVLAASEPLSLQTHPDADQARAGYQVGTYVDPYAKPELLCALTPFEAFCGIRPIDETVALLDDIGQQRLAAAFEQSGVRDTIRAVLGGRVPIDPVVDSCRSSDRPECRWVIRLAKRYPGDPSVLVTLLLNYVQLEPGEAIQLGPGNLHAYLSGAGIELMGASDNVVRAGLTSKRVNVDLLLDVMDPTPLLDPVMSTARSYPLSGTSIRLLRLVGPTQRTASTHELVVTASGATGYLAPHDTLDVPAGDIAFVATS
ncbi:mannose-6-phosphate isomerase, class I [Desertimonas flava]|jgi:mannose-6-phosphate isomerase|uniref:mannose-6-phosphate isomerase, class I n=1 Tax=Desertimonas flava TaxID=2064846 RepID=UPI000E34366D|nr:mannose-6-phosphate isomerase, class I [Desertimonas flava]